MAKYLSNRQKNLKVGISSYSENLTSLEVIGKVGIGTTNATSSLTVVGDGYFTGILTANRIISSVYGEFTGGSISGTNIVGTALSVSGISTFSNGPVFIGAATSTGTASQPLQVTGGAYVSGNLGIGSTTPTSKLTVVGDGNFSGIVTALNFVGDLIGAATGLTTTSNINTSGIITAFKFVGDGSSLTNLIAPSSGIGINSDGVTVGYAASIINFSSGISVTPIVLGITTVSVYYSPNSGIATYATSAGIATYATSAGIATYANNAGIATYSDTAGIATYATSAGIATYATNAGIATYATNAGISTYATSAGISTYATSAGIATYATSAGIATYATNAGIATYATNAGISTYATSAGISTYATSAGIATYATSAGIATYATNAGIATYATNAGISTYATSAGIATYATSAGIATYATNAGIATYATNAGIATYATSAGISTYATSAGIATYATNAGIATSLQNSRTFEITGDVVATAISFDGTGNVSLAATIQPNSVALGSDTTGDYVQSITGTSNQITVTSGTGEGSAPTLSIPNQFTVPQDATVTRDLQVNRNLNVNGNIIIGGTTATIFSQELKVFDPDIVLGFRTDAFGNDISTDNTANHGGVTVASTEGSPLVQLFVAGIETNPATYKKIMWFKAGEFAGLGTDAWLVNYAVGIGSTQFPTGTRLAAGSVQFTENDLSVVKNINASGIITGTLANTLTLNTSGTGLSGSATYNNSGAATFTVASNATSNNTPSTIVVRDASGNFSSGTITANLTGTASTASFATTAYNLTDASNITAGIINSARLTGTYTININGNASSATYATSAGIATYANNAGIATYSDTAGITTYATSAGIATYATSAGVSTNINGGLTGNIPYQSAPNTTTFLTNGSSGQILQSNGVGNAPTWVSSAPVNAITGLTILDEGTIVGGANSVSQINFVGNIISVASNAGIATVTFLDYVSNAGVSSSVIGGIASVTQLNVSGVSTVGLLTATNIGIGTTNATSSLTVVGDGYFTGILTANRIISSVYGEFTGGSISGTNIVGTALSVSGISTFSNGPVFIGAATSTGTANQRLQVVGGASFTGTNYNIGIGTTNPSYTFTVTDTGTPATSGLTNCLADFTTTANSYGQINLRNTSTGANASSDIIITADNGSDTTNFIDLGINNSGFSVGSWTINGANDGYLYTSDGNLSIGAINASVAKYISFFTGGTLISNERMRINDTGVGIGTTNPSQTLHVQGNARVTGAVYDSTNSPGTSGQVLQSTVTGTQWTTAAAAGGGGSGKFDTNIDNTLYIQPTGTLDIVGVGTTTTQITTFPAGSSEYIIHSIHVTNVSNGDAEITGGFLINSRAVPASISVSVGQSGSAGVNTITVGSASSIVPDMSVIGTGNIGETTGIGSTAGFQFNTYVTSVDGNVVSFSKPLSGRIVGVATFIPTSKFASRLPVPVGSAVELLKQPMILNALDSIVLQSTGAGTGIGSTSTAAISQTANSNILTVTAGAAITNFISAGQLIQGTGSNTGIQTNTYVGVGYTPGQLTVPMTRPATSTLSSQILSFTEVVVPQDGALQATIVYQTTTDTSFQNGTGTISATPSVYYGTGNTFPSIIQSIRVANISDGSIYPGGDYSVSVGIGNSDTIFSWLAYNMIIPKNSSIELCEAPKRLGIGQSIFASSDTPRVIEIQVAAKQKTS